MKNKTKKIISASFHALIYGFFAYEFNKGNQVTAFWCIFFLNIVNHLASITNHEFYLGMKKLNEQGNKISDQLIESCAKFQKIIEQKDKNFKDLRTKYVLAAGENLQIREMNNRLHEVNQTVVQENQRRH